MGSGEKEVKWSSDGDGVMDRMKAWTEELEFLESHSANEKARSWEKRRLQSEIKYNSGGSIQIKWMIRSCTLLVWCRNQVEQQGKELDIIEIRDQVIGWLININAQVGCYDTGNWGLGEHCEPTKVQYEWEEGWEQLEGQNSEDKKGYVLGMTSTLWA